MSRKRLTGRDQDGSVFPPGTICLRSRLHAGDSYADARSLSLDALKCPLRPVGACGRQSAPPSGIFLPNSVSTVAFLFFA